MMINARLHDNFRKPREPASGQLLQRWLRALLRRRDALWQFSSRLLLLLSLTALLGVLPARAAAAGDNKSANTAAALPTVTLMAGESLDEQGQPAPLRPETMRLLNFFERKLNVRFQIQRYPLARVNELLKQPGQLAFGMSKTSERLTYMQFSEPVFNGYVWIVTREDRQFEFSSLNDLAGKSVGIVRGMRLSDEIDRERNQLFRVEDDAAQAGARLRKLTSGRMDCLLMNSRHSNPRDLENELNQLLSESDSSLATGEPRLKVKVLNRPLLIDPIHFATNRRQPSPWLEKINAVLKAAQNSAELSTLLRP